MFVLFFTIINTAGRIIITLNNNYQISILFECKPFGNN